MFFMPLLTITLIQLLKFCIFVPPYENLIMKKRHFFIIAFILLILGLIYVPILQTKEAAETDNKPSGQALYLPVSTAQNKERIVQLNAYGQILANQQIDITMEVQGVLDQDLPSLKVGKTFSKGTMLLKVERTEALYNLLARRSSYINLIASLLPEISIDFPEEKSKWENYLNALNPAKELLSIPETKSRKEKLLVVSRNIPTEFYNIKALETQVEKYYYVAPFSGTVTASFVSPGAMVTPGMRIATIAKTNDYEVEAPVSIEHISQFEQVDNVYFTNHKGDTIGEGSFLRKSKVINQQTQSVPCFFSIKAANNQELIQGSFVSLSITLPLYEASIALPENAIINERVQVLRDSLVIEKPITILGEKTDSVFVKGINDGENVILEPITLIQGDTKKYVGIKK